MQFTENEKRTVEAVFGELVKMGYSECNRFLGSVTIGEMATLYYKLRYEEYCERNGIKYEDMTDEDWLEAEMEIHGY